MNFRKLGAMPFLAAALVLPTLAQADSMWHPEDGERNVSYHGDHFKSTKTRAEVRAEVEAARKDGTLALLQRNLPIPVKSAGPGKTRQQVIDELRNETPAERRARVEMNRGN